jgi:phosphomannomutase
VVAAQIYQGAERQRMAELIISVSGLRGIVGENLTPEVAIRYVAAFARSIPEGTIVVSRDGRTTGTMLRDAVISGLVACGRDVIDAGVTATPTVGVFLRSSGAAGAVQISASHNPPAYNGLKLFAADGRVIAAEAGRAVREAYQSGNPHYVGHEQIGRVARASDPHADHLEAVLRTVDVAKIRARRFRVLLDSNHGAGALLGMRLLEELGCEVTLNGPVPDGLFEHPPEPTADNLREIGARVRALGCVAGFCQDPDADRLALIDSDGNYLGEEYTAALCIMHRLAQDPGPVVINCATSGMTQWLAAQHGVACVRSPVGEANVVDRMLEVDAVYGGEGNGGPIDPRVGLVRDSFVGMAQVLDLMAARQQSLADLAATLPRLAIYKTKATIDTDRLPAIFQALQAAMPEATADTSDGLRLTWPDRWLLVRGSNTEPIVRLIAEAPRQQEAEQLCQRAASLIEEVCSP